MRDTPSRSRWAAAVALALVLLLVAAWWATRPGPPSAAREPLERGTVSTDRRAARRPAEIPEPTSQPEGEVAVDAMGALARVEGRGHVRCPVGDVVSGPVTAKGLLRARVSGGVLVAQVDEPAGTAAVYAQVAPEPKLQAVELPDGQVAFTQDPEEDGSEDDASLPRAHVEWTGATPGTLGTCRVIPVEVVEFVVGAADGGASFGAVTDGACAVLLTRSSLPDSRYVVRGARGVSCEVTLFRAEEADDGTRSVLNGMAWIEDPRADVVYPVASWSLPGSDGSPDDKPADEAEVDVPPDAWERVFALDDLSPESRDLLLEWQEGEFQQGDEVAQGWKLLEDQLANPPPAP